MTLGWDRELLVLRQILILLDQRIKLGKYLRGLLRRFLLGQLCLFVPLLRECKEAEERLMVLRCALSREARLYEW